MKKHLTLKNGIFLLVLILCSSGFFISGFFFGHSTIPGIEAVTTLSGKEDGKPGSVDFSTFWKAWNILNEKYVITHGGDPKTDQDKVYGAIQGLTAALGDPYTVFFPPSDAKLFDSQIAGNFEGVGMEVGQKDGIITVIAPLKDTPAFKAGIKTGDIILKINGTSTESMSVDKAVDLIRGPGGTQVKLNILRDGTKDPFDISITRGQIDIPTIDTKVRDDGIFVISLYSFSENSAALFQNALQKFVDSGKDNLIIDLRGNPGGYLDAAVNMASWFLPEGQVVVRESYGAGKDEDVYTSKGYNVFDKLGKKVHIVILVDSGSASASEILSGALQEHKVATLVGTKTFGKGSVQEVVKLTPDTELKVTIARWLTPSGLSISQNGLTPNVLVKVDPAVLEKDPTADPQMDKAAQLLLTGQIPSPDTSAPVTAFASSTPAVSQ